MKITNELLDAIAEIRRHLENDPPQNDIYKQLERLCCKDVILQLEAIQAVVISEAGANIHQKIELFLSHHWKRINGSMLAYTAMHQCPLVPSLYKLASCLSEADSHIPPRAPLEFMMPGVSLMSYDLQFRHWCAFELTRALTEAEMMRLQELSVISSLRPLSESEAGVFLTLEQRRSAYENEQMLLENGDTTRVGQYFIPQLTNPQAFFSKHILTFDGTGIIPISIILDPNATNPYAKSLQPSEKYRMTQHSAETIALAKEKDLLRRLENQDKSILGQLDYLCGQLRLNDSHIGRGTNHDAASGAYVAIIKFQEYYQTLSKGTQHRLPNNLTEQIALLFQLSSNPTKNHNATENIDTCLANRRIAIEKCMEGHRDKISQIEISDAEFTTCLHTQKKEVENAENTLKELLKTPYYFGKDTLPLTPQLINYYTPDFFFRNEEELSALLLLPPADAAIIASSRETELINCISEYNHLIIFMTNTPLSLLENFYSILSGALIKKFLLGRPRDAMELLERLEDDKFLQLLEVLIKAEYFNNHTAWYNCFQLPYPPILQNFIHSDSALLRILELIPKKVRLIKILELNANKNSLINCIASRPKTIRAILMTLSEDERIMVMKSLDSRYNYTYVHLYSNNPSVIQSMLATLSKASQYQLLQDVITTGNHWKNTPVLLAAESNAVGTLSLFRNVLSAEDFIALVKQQNAYKLTPLQIACLRGYSTIAGYLMSALPAVDRPNELKRRYQNRNTALHLAIAHPEILTILLNLCPEDQRLDVIQQRNEDGLSVLELGMNIPDSVEAILRSLSEQNRFLIINEKNPSGSSIMHFAAIHGCSKTLLLLHTLTSKQAAPQPIFAQTKAKFTPLHFAAKHNRPEVLSIILSLYPPKERCRAIQQKNIYDESVIQMVLDKEPMLLMILSTLPKEDLIKLPREGTFLNPNELRQLLQIYIMHFPLVLACHPEIYEVTCWRCSEWDGKLLVKNALKAYINALNNGPSIPNVAPTLFFKNNQLFKNATLITSINRYLTDAPLSEEDKNHLRQGKCGKIFDCYKTLFRISLLDTSMSPAPPPTAMPKASYKRSFSSANGPEYK